MLAFLFGVEPSVELQSTLSLDACLEKLADGVDSLSSWSGSKPVQGEVKRSHFVGRKRSRYRNAFRTYVRARLVSEGASTRLDCRFGMAPLVNLFLIVWFAPLAALSGGLLFNALATALSPQAVGHPDLSAASGQVLLAPSTLMMALGYSLVRLGRRLARDDRPFLIAFLSRTTDAKPRS